MATPDRQWSPADLARSARIDPGTVTDFLSGRRWPQMKNRTKIENALGLAIGAIEAAAEARLVGPDPEDRPYVGTDSSSPGDQNDPIADIARIARELADAAERLQANRGPQPVDPPRPTRSGS